MAANATGIVIVYTGPGKGKTTAALGAALRILGHGLAVCLVQFVKSPRRKSGEREAARAFGGRFAVHALGEGFIYTPDDAPRHKAAARAAWKLAAGRLRSGAYDLVILDEISHVLTLGFLPARAVLSALRSRPAHVHVCLTGRDMPEAITAAADLVTVMEEKAHPYRKGMKNIRGIDF